MEKSFKLNTQELSKKSNFPCTITKTKCMKYNVRLRHNLQICKINNFASQN